MTISIDSAIFNRLLIYNNILVEHVIIDFYILTYKLTS
jgi:hypothetical protein